MTTRNAAERQQALEIIKRLQPDGATPVSQSLAVAGRQVGGTSPDDAAIIILITDGAESCEANPCAVATQLKQLKPYLAVHVVKLGPEESSACVANATGGKVYQPSSLDELLAAMKEARITAPFELGCEAP